MRAEPRTCVEPDDKVSMRTSRDVLAHPEAMQLKRAEAHDQNTVPRTATLIRCRSQPHYMWRYMRGLLATLGHRIVKRQSAKDASQGCGLEQESTMCSCRGHTEEWACSGWSAQKSPAQQLSRRAPPDLQCVRATLLQVYLGLRLPCIILVCTEAYKHRACQLCRLDRH